METNVRQFLTFVLGEETYGLDVTHVREVLEVIPITAMPRTAEHVLGVINVRGSVVPVVDLRLRFGIARAEKTINTCIVVLDVPRDGGTTVLGALVDAVREGVDFDAARIEPPPKVGVGLGNAYLEGIGKQEDRFILILDIRKVFRDEDAAPEAETGLKKAV